MELINISFLKALGITLFHSIWQATLIALVMSLILSLIKKKHAKSRYMVSLAALFAVFATSIFTFGTLYESTSLTPIQSFETEISNVYYHFAIASNEKGLIGQFKDLLIQNIQWITLLWALGMLFFMVKILVGVHFTRNIKSASRKMIEPRVWKLLNQLKLKANLSTYIDLRESLKIQTPSVIGYLKPCIYFPVGLINNLNVQEVEAILAHELAHIVRHDFLINIIQSIVETFYYFHPAVWWISANIRNERENACDDLAIDIVGNKLQYAKSLLLLQQWEVGATAGIAMSLSSKGSPLFERMKRILNQPKNKHEMKQKIFASLILMSSILWISATNTSLDIDSENPKTEQKTIPLAELSEIGNFNSISEGFQDTIPEKIRKSKSTILELEDGQLKRLEIDGKEIPQEEFEEHTIILGEKGKRKSWPFMINGDSTLTYFYGDSYGFGYDEDVKEKMAEMFEEMRFLNDSSWVDLNKTRHSFDKFDQEWRFNFDGHMDNLDSISKRFLIHDSMRVNMNDLHLRMGELHQQMNDMHQGFSFITDSTDFSMLHSDAFQFLDSFDFEEMGNNLRFHFDSIDFPDAGNQFHFQFGDQHSGNSLENAFIDEIRKDGLFNDDGNEIKLSFQELEINGELQPKEVHERYKSIYEKKTGVELLDGSSLHIKIGNGSNNDSRKRNLRRF